MRVAALGATVLFLQACIGGSPTPKPAMTPSPIVTPDVTPTAQLRTPEATPTLSPAQILQNEFANYTGGVDSTGQKVEQTNLPAKGRFALFAGDEELAPANILAFNGVVNTDYTQPLVETQSQGYLLDSRIVKASNSEDYLIAYMVQESAKDKDGIGVQYILPVNLGSVDPGSRDLDILMTEKGIIASAPATTVKSLDCSPAVMEAQIANLHGRFVIFTLDVIRDPQGYEKFRDADFIMAQNAISKDVIEYSRKTLGQPYDKVSQSKLIANVINRQIEDGFDISSVAGSQALSFS